MRLLAKVVQLLRDQRGQAMVEYSSITFAILIAAGAAAWVFPIPNGAHNTTLAQALYASLQTYVDSFYYSLHLVAP